MFQLEPCNKCLVSAVCRSPCENYLELKGKRKSNLIRFMKLACIIIIVCFFGIFLKDSLVKNLISYIPLVTAVIYDSYLVFDMWMSKKEEKKFNGWM